MKYHFIGIGGIGMSGLAQILLEKKILVQGSDLSSNFLTKKLQDNGALIFSSHAASHVPAFATIVYNTQIKKSHPEYVAATALNLPIIHRADLLAHLMDGFTSFLVTGTHGKTTVSTLLAFTLDVAKKNPSFALGGISLNFGTNARHSGGTYFVAEADESDGSFIKYHPCGAIITNIENDHLDLWGSKEALVAGFKNFAHNVSQSLWYNGDDPILASLSLNGKKFGFGNNSDVQILRWHQEEWWLYIDFFYKGKPYLDFEIPLIGKHNVLNAAAVFGFVMEMGIEEALIRTAFKTFKGVKRRMEKKGETLGVCFYDDYAHHPTEIMTTLQGVRQAVGEKRLIVIFQPHRYTRFQSFWHEFLGCFAQADVVVITDVYGADEIPIPSVDSFRFYNEYKEGNRKQVYYFSKENLISDLPKFFRPHDVVITLGAGDITSICAELAKQPISPYRMGVCQGGESAEHEISLLSAKRTMEAMNRSYYNTTLFTITKNGEWLENGEKKSMPEIVQSLLKCDVAFPIFHGPCGEDGMLQGFFETLKLAYVGCDFRSCVVAMDKVWTKEIAMAKQVKVAPFSSFSVHQWEMNPEEVYNEILQKFSFPFYVKASHLGSSIGVHRVVDKESLFSAIRDIATLDSSFLVEEEVVGHEIFIGCLGNHTTLVSDPVPASLKGFLSYEKKYCENSSKENSNFELTKKEKEKGQLLAKIVYEALHCRGLARIDFFLQEGGTWILNEVNPMPGLTSCSAFPDMWKRFGFSFEKVIDRLVISALHWKRYCDSHLCPPSAPPVVL